MENTDLKTFFENNESYTSFERKREISNLTNGFDLNLLTELSNSFVEYCFLKFNKINYSLPTIERPEKKEGEIWLNEFHFPFYDFIQNEIQKEVRIETFNNISFNDCLKFNSYMNTFLEEIENIIENQNIKINGIKSITPEEPQQPEANNTDEELHKNEYITIFKNDLGFLIFNKMFELYKPDNKDLANFSFLFYAMEKDFLVCNQTNFIKFLENDKYDVNIEKIDSRQSGENKKSKLYNSIKETLQKKHEKGTI
jgi:small nuclear ribonucleoprotein (snRNP)-like protein